MAKTRKKANWLRHIKPVYFLTVMMLYLLIFGLGYAISSAILTVLQAHPYFFLLVAIILLLADIQATNFVVNRIWRARWIHRDITN